MCVGFDRVLFKQRDNRFFPASAYALALLLVRVPFQLAEAALYTVVVYFWVGACSCSPPFSYSSMPIPESACASSGVLPEHGYSPKIPVVKLSE